MCETSLSVEKNKKQDKQEENVLLLVAAAAAVGDPHSLRNKVVTLATFQSPMGWLNALAP